MRCSKLTSWALLLHSEVCVIVVFYLRMIVLGADVHVRDFWNIERHQASNLTSRTLVSARCPFDLLQDRHRQARPLLFQIQSTSTLTWSLLLLLLKLLVFGSLLAFFVSSIHVLFYHVSSCWVVHRFLVLWVKTATRVTYATSSVIRDHWHSHFSLVTWQLQSAGSSRSLRDANALSLGLHRLAIDPRVRIHVLQIPNLFLLSQLFGCWGSKSCRFLSGRWWFFLCRLNILLLPNFLSYLHRLVHRWSEQSFFLAKLFIQLWLQHRGAIFRCLQLLLT